MVQYELIRGGFVEKLDHILYKKEHPAEFSKIVNTGLADLDSSTAFLCKGELSLFGARPGMGKTAVAVQIAQSVAQQGLRVSWVSTWLSQCPVQKSEQGIKMSHRGTQFKPAEKGAPSVRVHRGSA